MLGAHNAANSNACCVFGYIDKFSDGLLIPDEVPLASDMTAEIASELHMDGKMSIHCVA